MYALDARPWECSDVEALPSLCSPLLTHLRCYALARLSSSALAPLVLAVRHRRRTRHPKDKNNARQVRCRRCLYPSHSSRCVCVCVFVCGIRNVPRPLSVFHNALRQRRWCFPTTQRYDRCSCALSFPPAVLSFFFSPSLFFFFSGLVFLFFFFLFCCCLRVVQNRSTPSRTHITTWFVFTVGERVVADRLRCSSFSPTTSARQQPH